MNALRKRYYLAAKQIIKRWDELMAIDKDYTCPVVFIRHYRKPQVTLKEQELFHGYCVDLFPVKDVGARCPCYHYKARKIKSTIAKLDKSFYGGKP